MLLGNILQGTERTNFFLDWICNSFDFPHCNTVNSIASLRTGVAIAQILTQCIPQQYHYLFINDIFLSDLTPQRCIENFRAILSTIEKCYSHDKQAMLVMKLNAYTPEQLYYEESSLQHFGINVVMILKNYSCNTEQFTSMNESQHHKQTSKRKQNKSINKTYRSNSQISCKKHKSNLNTTLEEVSQINNLYTRAQTQAKHSIIESYSQNKSFVGQSSELKQDINHQYIQKLKQKMKQKIIEWYPTFINFPQHVLMGELVNQIFKEKKLNEAQKIIKPVHFDMGPSAVYNKITNYLIEIERIRKDNLLDMIEDLECGEVRESVFWGVVNDLFAFKQGKNPARVLSLNKKHRRSKLKSIDFNTFQNKKKSNQCKKQEINKKQKNNLQNRNKKDAPIYQKNTIDQIQKWISDVLGYSHSLNKSKNQKNLLKNPLLNGVLIGSIVMRLQISKLSLIKQPQNKKQLERNKEEIANALIKRGYECGRMLFTYAPTYNMHLGLVHQMKQQHHKKQMQLQKHCNKIYTALSKENKKKIHVWLEKQKKIEIEHYPQMRINKFVQICAELLNISILRQTTVKIKENNFSKIIEELRRLGFRNYSQKQIYEQDIVRWNIIKQTVNIMKESIQYFQEQQ